MKRLELCLVFNLNKRFFEESTISEKVKSIGCKQTENEDNIVRYFVNLPRQNHWFDKFTEYPY